MNCALPLVLLALSNGEDPEGLLLPPIEHVQPGPPEGKGDLGEPLEHRLDSVNFSVQWDGELSEAIAERTLDLLEASWTALVEEQGWQAPISSEDWLLRVVLDPSLNWTGTTVPVDNPLYPEGVPVIVLNPANASNAVFWAHLVSHEFAHALQYALRTDYDGADFSWYWEASAEWSVELADPDLDHYAYQTRYYARSPEQRYSSLDGFHAYGMVLLNAALSDQEGPQLLRRVWEDSASAPEARWDWILEDSLDRPIDDIWGPFTGQLGNGLLPESELYEPLALSPLELDQELGLAYLGTRYHRIEEDITLQAQGPVLLAGPEGWGDRVELREGDVLAVSGLDEVRADYRLEEATLFNRGGGCSSSGGPSTWLWLTPALLLALRSSRHARSGCSRTRSSRRG